MSETRAPLCRIVAITGRSGSGKSTVSAHYAARGYPVLDGDAVAREVVQPGSECLAALVREFGTDLLDETGALHRRELAARAFATPQAAKALTDITHPAIVRRLLEKAQCAAQAGAHLVFVDGAVIVGAAFQPYCDAIIVVTAPQQEAVMRIVLRDGISKQAARQRLAAQMPEQQLVAAADYVLHNTGTQGMLLAQAEAVLQQLEQPWQ